MLIREHASSLEVFYRHSQKTEEAKDDKECLVAPRHLSYEEGLLLHPTAEHSLSHCSALFLWQYFSRAQSDLRSVLRTHSRRRAGATATLLFGAGSPMEMHTPLPQGPAVRRAGGEKVTFSLLPQIQAAWKRLCQSHGGRSLSSCLTGFSVSETPGLSSRSRGDDRTRCGLAAEGGGR